MIFIHIPKTAGTYVEQYLNNNKINHTYYCHKFIMFDDNIRLNNKIFTTIRDPIQRMVSTYFYSVKYLDNNIWYNQSNLTAKQTHFKIKELYEKYNIKNVYDYINNYECIYKEIYEEIDNYEKMYTLQNNNNMTHYYGGLFYPQYVYLIDKNNNLICDNIINVSNENLNEKLNYIFNIKCEFNKKINESNRNDINYYDYFTKETLIKTIKILKDDYIFLKKYINPIITLKNENIDINIYNVINEI